MVHALEHATPEEHDAIVQVLADGAFTQVRYEDVLATLDRYGSVKFAMGVAQKHAERARRALDPLPESEYKRALLWVPDFVVNRER